MITLRPAAQRGHFAIDWLNSWHTFSFGEYFDQDHLGWGPLRVINDDTVAPEGGFATHGHRDMEIVSYVLSGQLQHKDSLGTGSIIRPAEIQRMRAGSGIRHSEYNPSSSEPVHFLQIWLIPHTAGLAPGYAQQAIDVEQLQRDWVLLAAPEGEGGLVEVASHARLSATRLAAGEERQTSLTTPKAYVHVAYGHVSLNGQPLQTGDGAYIAAEAELTLVAQQAAEVLLFELAD